MLRIIEGEELIRRLLRANLGDFRVTDHPESGTIEVPYGVLRALLDEWGMS